MSAETRPATCSSTRAHHAHAEKDFGTFLRAFCDLLRPCRHGKTCQLAHVGSFDSTRARDWPEEGYPGEAGVMSSALHVKTLDELEVTLDQSVDYLEAMPKRDIVHSRPCVTGSLRLDYLASLTKM